MNTYSGTNVNFSLDKCHVTWSAIFSYIQDHQVQNSYRGFSLYNLYQLLKAFTVKCTGKLAKYFIYLYYQMSIFWLLI